jgi:hypothetical protein
MQRFHFTSVASAIGATLLAMAASTQTAYACAACGCSLNADWDNAGLSSPTGFTLDVRYDYLNQDQLRSGNGTISSAAASQVTSNGESQEVERFTRNNYLTATLGYNVTPDWNLTLQLPYIVRSHSTLGTASDGTTAGADGGQYDSHTSSIGDVKLMARYQGLLPTRRLALLFGVKLPTGSHTQTGTSTDPAVSEPAPIDRGLQPGSGTTDVIVGLSQVGSLAPEWSYMVQGLFQTALKSRDDYRPGNGLNINAGLRYTALVSVQPELQLNIRHNESEVGSNGDKANTGGTLVYLSPGVQVPLSKQLWAYGYTRLPVYQHVTGVQLTPRFTASIGLRYAF